MSEAEARLCFECEQQITEGEQYLRLRIADGSTQFMHSFCFTRTTFDPDKFLLVDPETDA